MNHVFINLLQAIFRRKLCIIFLATLFEMHRVKYIWADENAEEKKQPEKWILFMFFN